MGGVGLGGQGRCEQRSEVFVKIQKKKSFFLGGGGVREIIRGKPEICVCHFSMRNPYMKFQDDISMPHTNTHTHTYGQAETNLSPTFSKLGAQKCPEGTWPILNFMYKKRS